MNDAEIALSWKMRCEELEAEVERLRAELDEIRHGYPAGVRREARIRELKSEVERLADMAAFYAKGMDKQHAEVDRLKETLLQVRLHREADMPGTADAWMYSEELRQAEAEVEQLEAENKWLTDNLEAQDRLRENAEAEVERLRNNRDQAANEVGRLSQEVGRLQDERDAENLRADENYEVVERLRGALERLEQLAEHGYPTRSVSLEMVRHERRAALAKEEG